MPPLRRGCSLPLLADGRVRTAVVGSAGEQSITSPFAPAASPVQGLPTSKVFLLFFPFQHAPVLLSSSLCSQISGRPAPSWSGSPASPRNHCLNGNGDQVHSPGAGAGLDTNTPGVDRSHGTAAGDRRPGSHADLSYRSTAGQCLPWLIFHSQRSPVLHWERSLRSPYNELLAGTHFATELYRIFHNTFSKELCNCILSFLEIHKN